MSYTNLILGGNWPHGEWPDHVEVGHEGETDCKVYVPERACRDVGDGGKFVCSKCGASFDYEGRWDEPTYWVDDVAAAVEYCPNCGARVMYE